MSDEIHPLLGHPDAPDWQHMNQPFGSIQPSAPTPSQRLGNVATNALVSAGAQPYVANHLVSGIGNLLGMTPLAAPMFAADLIDAQNRGDMGGAAQAAIGMIPAAREMDIPAVAEKLAKLAEGMGYSVGRDASNVSRSEYLNLAHPALDNDLKIRISDHSLPPSYQNAADIEVGPHGEATGWANAADWMAKKIGASTPQDAAAQLAQDEADRVALAKAAQDRVSTELARQEARASALANAASSPNAERIAEIQARLQDPSIAGNQRKKLNGKLRDLLK